MKYPIIENELNEVETERSTSFFRERWAKKLIGSETVRNEQKK